MAPTRLVSEDGRFDALLLRSGLRDEPDPGALRRAEAALGLGAGVALVGASASASKWSALKLGSSHSLTKFGAVEALKWLGAGLVSGALAVTGIRYAVVSLREPPAMTAATGGPSRRAALADEPRRPAAPADEPRRHAALADEPRRGAALADEPRRGAALADEPRRHAALADEPHRDAAHASEAQPLPPPRATRVSAPKATSPQETVEAARSQPSMAASPLPDPPSEAATQQENALADEVAILEGARRALFAGRPDATLRELDAYERLPNKAVLRSEAELLRIEALVRKGNRRAAQALAKRSLERAPNGPHALRLREIAAPP